MKVILYVNELVNKLQRISSIISHRNVHPILSNIILETVNNNKLRLYMTDFDVWIVDYVGAEVVEEGTVGIRLDKLTDLCKEFKLCGGKNISLGMTDNGVVEILWERSRYTIPCIPPSDYPENQEIKSNIRLTLPASELQTMLRKTSFAVDERNPDKSLTGIHFCLTESALEMTGFQYSRLAVIRRSCTISGEHEKEVCIILPKRVAVELIRFLEDENRDITISIGDNDVIFDMGRTTITSTVLEGKHRDYSIDSLSKPVGLCKCDRSDLSAMLRRASLMSLDRVVSLTIADNCLTIKACHPEYGTAEEQIDVEYTGEDRYTGEISIGNIMEFLKNTEGSRIEIFLYKEPMIMVKDLEDPEYFCIMTLIVS